MAKRKSMVSKIPSKKKPKKPNVGDTVYVIGEVEFKPWTFLEKVTKDGKEQARCSTSVYDINMDSAEIIEEIFPIDSLTLEPPLLPPSSIYLM